jgi:hypothetical protein
MRWFRHHDRGDRTLSADGTESTRSIEAFFVGNYLGYARLREEVVPGWARLNVFAHGDLREIRQIRDPLLLRSEVIADQCEATWTAARRVLAAELLQLVDNDPEMLTRVQRAVLVPLELELIEAEAASQLTASDLVRSTRAAFRSSM